MTKVCGAIASSRRWRQSGKRVSNSEAATGKLIVALIKVTLEGIISMLEPRPIRTEADYRAALAEIERLFDAELNTPKSDRLEVLTQGWIWG